MSMDRRVLWLTVSNMVESSWRMRTDGILVDLVTWSFSLMDTRLDSVEWSRLVRTWKIVLAKIRDS